MFMTRNIVAFSNPSNNDYNKILVNMMFSGIRSAGNMFHLSDFLGILYLNGTIKTKKLINRFED